MTQKLFYGAMDNKQAVLQQEYTVQKQSLTDLATKIGELESEIDEHR